MTRSQSGKSSESPEKQHKAVNLDNNLVDGLTTLADIPTFEPDRSPENEMVRHSPFLRPDAPEFSPCAPLDPILVPDIQVNFPDTSFSETSSDITPINSDSEIISDDEFDADHDDVMPRGRCHPTCSYGSTDDELVDLKVFSCDKCEYFKICERCLSDGAHKPHTKYLKLVDDVV